MLEISCIYLSIYLCIYLFIDSFNIETYHHLKPQSRVYVGTVGRYVPRRARSEYYDSMTQEEVVIGYRVLSHSRRFSDTTTSEVVQTRSNPYITTFTIKPSHSEDFFPIYCQHLQKSSVPSIYKFIVFPI